MRHRILAGVVALLTGATTVSAQPASRPADDSDTQALVALTQRFFDAMQACDADALRALSVPEGRLYRVMVGGAPAEAPASSTFEAFAASTGACRRKVLERMWEPRVSVHKDIATLRAPYDFWIDGQFSHCGIDEFGFVRTATGWRMVSGLYTIERDGCAPSPLGAPR